VLYFALLSIARLTLFAFIKQSKEMSEIIGISCFFKGNYFPKSLFFEYFKKGKNALP